MTDQLREFDHWHDWRAAIQPDLSEITAADRKTDDAGMVRVVFDFEIGPAECHAGFAGMAGELFAVAFQHVEGFFVGRPGPTMLINTRSLEDSYQFADLRFMCATSIAAHELAHFYDHRSLRGYTPSRLGAEDIFRRVVLPQLAEDGDDDRTQHARHSIDHGRFVRRSLHIAHRLMVRGWRTPVNFLHDWEPPEAWQTFRALGDELERLEGLTIRQVDLIPPPAAFAELFQEYQEAVA